MAGRGAPIGNQNATRGGRVRAAIERALDSKSRVLGQQALDAIAAQLIEDALNAESVRERMAAAQEIFDRVDGKASQSVDVHTTGDITVRSEGLSATAEWLSGVLGAGQAEPVPQPSTH